MDWIRSSGGPLICIERDLAPLWTGIRGSKHSDLGDIEIADYDRACQVRDYVGRVAVAGRHALILGDMPLQTMVWCPINQLPLIVRVFYADPEADVIGILAKMLELDFSEPTEVIGFKVESGSILIFDSALSGSNVGEKCLSFELSPAAYLVMTKQFEPDERTSVLVHKFIRGT